MAFAENCPEKAAALLQGISQSEPPAHNSANAHPLSQQNMPTAGRLDVDKGICMGIEAITQRAQNAMALSHLCRAAVPRVLWLLCILFSLHNLYLIEYDTLYHNLT